MKIFRKFSPLNVVSENKPSELATLHHNYPVYYTSIHILPS